MREYNSSTCIEHKNTTVIFSKEAYKIFTCNFAPKGTNQASYNTTPYKTKQNKRKHRNNEFTKNGCLVFRVRCYCHISLFCRPITIVYYQLLNTNINLGSIQLFWLYLTSAYTLICLSGN